MGQHPISMSLFSKRIPNQILYIRELPIPVHTKFIERNKTLIKDLLNILIAEHICKKKANLKNDLI